MPPTSDARFSFEIEGFDQPLRVARVRGTERISDAYEFHITLASESDALDLDAAVARPALLTIRSDEGKAPRYIHGIISRFEQGDSGKRSTAYHATLVPRAWLLLLREDCRIFQEQAAPDIIAAVLTSAGLSAGADFRLSLSGNYPPREYCVQFRESDWDFIQRLMEEEGICCFFEHRDGGHTMVLGDGPAAHPPIPGESALAFRSPTDSGKSGEHVARFHYAHAIRPEKVTLRDYDFKKPAFQLESVSGGGSGPAIEVYRYPGSYSAPEVGDGRAKVRLEQLQVPKRVGEGESSCARLTPGCVFSMTEHGRDAFNRGYLLLSVEHEGVEAVMQEDSESSPTRYENRFTCIPSDVPFRPAQRTPRPMVTSVQSAVVVGPPGEEIHTDEYGRVKVQFHWDRLGKRDDKSSCWIRVGQVWGGVGFGGMHIPRVGNEVLVGFLDGDPDRPVVVGRVYHEVNRPPYPLPAEKAKSTIKSSSYPGGGGDNELRFDDAAGEEEVYLHAQKDWKIAVENDKNQTVGRDEAASVGRNRAMSVGQDHTEDVGSNQTVKVGRDRTETVGNDETLSVGHDETVSIGNNETKSVGADRALNVTRNEAISVGADRTLGIAGSQTTTVGADRTLVVGASSSEAVTGDRIIEVQGGHYERVFGERTFSVERDNVEVVGGSETLIVEGNRSVTVEGNEARIVDGTSDIAIGGALRCAVTGSCSVTSEGAMEITSTASQTFDAPVQTIAADTSITLQVGSCALEITATAVTLSAFGSTLTISAEGVVASSDADIDIKGKMIKLNS